MASKYGEKMKTMLASRRGKVIFIVVIVLILGGAALGGWLGYQSYKYVSTDNALISAPLIPVTVLASYQIISMDVDYGSYVEKGQKIATVGAPALIIRPTGRDSAISPWDAQASSHRSADILPPSGATRSPS